MTLFWRKLWRIMANLKFNRHTVAVVSPAPDQARRAAESRRTLRNSQALLSKVESRESDVDSLHRSMRRIGEQNGFAELIYRSLGGGE